MAKIITVFNQKGGVGKTTTVINLATALSYKKKRVLIVDLDPQANASSGLGLQADQIQKSIYDVLVDQVNPKEVILTTGYENLFLLPSEIALSSADLLLSEKENSNFLLKNELDSIRDDFDYIFIDSPPSLNILSINSLVAADSVLIPIQCEYYALEGLVQLLNTIQDIKSGPNPNLVIEGIVLTMSSRTNLSRTVEREILEQFGKKVYKTLIPRTIRLAEAPSYGVTIFEYSYNSSGSKAYLELANEFQERQDT